MAQSATEVTDRTATAQPGAPAPGQSRMRRAATLLAAGPGDLTSPAGRLAANATAVAGALLILASAAIHLHLWATGYRHIATVGPLFLLQGILSVPLALALAAWRRAWITAAGAALMVATAFGLLLSHWVALFGYRESLAVPYAGMSLVVEFAAAALLGAATGLMVWGRRAPLGGEGAPRRASTGPARPRR